eukprot:CAMPEP_0197837396 /NCGR_PEP_ID=MMETSP1437-20131217/32022_1 /TAXON_ID=49252 ORGANISM="Eucampia antarctica, Strain CCMP1452" /NCGR_SAMPLE_ID=MMETSP1437 /ASSEMBLY_ACC=CAM_ASM_001096 /LENGTH=430 /DNA_ID=CAMNT_0043444407 /DNA_START=54 /DNA_END=1346 /DNA_ORIENTATION=+
MARVGAHARHTFHEVQEAGPALRPRDFPPPEVGRGVRVQALVVHQATGQREVLSGVIHREELLHMGAQTASSGGKRSQHGIKDTPRKPGKGSKEYVAYWPQRRLQDAIYGSVWACLVLRRHYGPAADDAARAAGVEPGDPLAPVVWEILGDHVAIKMVEWAKVHHFRGRLLEDPVKEIAAMQLLGTKNPHVLGSQEVLQDDDFLFSIMPYCRGGDLFGIVVEYTEQRNGEGGMIEPVARYWFKQIIQGLHHLQQTGVCHRDLSLENVLVDDQNCVVIDMGMCLRVPYTDPKSEQARADVALGTMRRLMRPQGVCGKMQYMSPETYKNDDSFDGFAIDLWAAGVILYIMLTGFPPYDHPSIKDQRFEIIVTGQLVEQLQNWDITMSKNAGDLLQSMLRFHPRERLTLAQVIEHPWITDPDVQPPPPIDTAL